MAANRTSLSAGAILRAVLLEDPAVSQLVNKIFPVASPVAELPYIVYRRDSLEARPQKHGAPGSDSVVMEVLCFTERYGDGVALAEAVRNALDMVDASHDGLEMRGCYLADSDESFEGDAYVQRLVFNLKM